MRVLNCSWSLYMSVRGGLILSKGVVTLAKLWGSFTGKERPLAIVNNIAMHTVSHCFLTSKPISSIHLIFPIREGTAICKFGFMCHWLPAIYSCTKQMLQTSVLPLPYYFIILSRWFVVQTVLPFTARHYSSCYFPTAANKASVLHIHGKQLTDSDWLSMFLLFKSWIKKNALKLIPMISFFCYYCYNVGMDQCLQHDFDKGEPQQREKPLKKPRKGLF